MWCIVVSGKLANGHIMFQERNQAFNQCLISTLMCIFPYFQTNKQKIWSHQLDLLMLRHWGNCSMTEEFIHL